jgi:hypothetical protein
MLKASLKGRPSVYRIRQIETPMETQAIRSQIEAATPMAPLPSKPIKAARRSTIPMTQSQADTASRRFLKTQRGMLRD